MNILFDKTKLILDVFALAVGHIYVLFELISPIFEILYLVLSFSFILLNKKLILFDFRVKVFIVVFQCIDLLGKKIYKVKETIVLLLCFNEGSYNLIYILDTTVFFDLLEGLFNNCCIFYVLVY